VIDVLPLFAAAWLITVGVETAVLVAFLSPRHPLGTRLEAGLWLSSITLPIVWFVIPALVDPVHHRAVFLAVAETFAPAAECAFFACAHPLSRRDAAAIVAANLASFAVGEAL
jgi:hypothetical protein